MPDDIGNSSEWKRRRAEHGEAPKVTIEHRDEGSVVLPDHADRTTGAQELALVFGTTEIDLATMLLQQLMNAIHPGRGAQPIDSMELNAAIAAMKGIDPKDEIEGMLAAQMVATHHAAMEMMRRANQASDPAKFQTASTFATKLLRTYTAQVEALNRHRGKGAQRVTVEHVHVHEGGQAIVGNVESGGRGGGSAKSRERPHAPNGNQARPYAPSSQVPSQDQAGDSVPVARN